MILVGINVETTLMFMVFGLAVAKVLPANKKHRILITLAFTVFAAAVETLLNAWGALSWDYSWWGWPNLWSVMLFAYGPATAATIWLHDMKSWRRKLCILTGVYLFDIICLVVFAGVLKWI